MRLWRISEFADLSGDGGHYHAGRWNEVGTAVVYCSDHPSTALLEILVHTDREDITPTYQLLEIDAPDSSKIFLPELPRDWADRYSRTQMIGNNFLVDVEYPLMRIPSIVMPQAFNYLLNPAHPDAAAFRIAQTWRYPFDSRLLS
jgi:RES domain-containing protein